MKKLTLAIFILAFLLFRPYQLASTGMLYSDDDYSYLAHATAIVYGEFPSYAKEYFQNEGGRPQHSIGPGITAAPFVWLFSLLDRISGNSIVEQRTSDNLADSWTTFGFIISSMVYLWLGCFFLYKVLRFYVDEKVAVWAVVLMVLVQGIPLFAYRRPIFSHAPSFCVQSFFILWALMPSAHRWRWMSAWTGVIVAGFLSALLFLIRPSNVFFALFWPVAIFFFERTKDKGWQKVLVTWAVCGGLIAVKYVMSGQAQAYLDAVKDRLLIVHSCSFYVRRLMHVVAGIDWGLIFTAPFLLVGLGRLFIRDLPFKKVLLFMAALLLFNLYIVLNWGTQASWYGYRYLIPIAVPVLIVPFAMLMNDWRKKPGHMIALGVLAIQPILSMLSFEGKSDKLTLSFIDQGFGFSGWGNQTYQLNIWQILIHQPTTLLITFLKGIPIYLAQCCHLVSLSMYEHVPPSLHIKTVLVLVLPWGLWWLGQKFWPDIRQTRK